MNIDKTRLATLVIARLATCKKPPSTHELAKALQRFMPTEYSDVSWREEIETTVTSLVEQAAPKELARRLGTHGTKTWPQLADKVFPALALGVAADDAKVHTRLTGRDEWTAAIAARALGLWTTGAPPSLSAVCDAYAWQQLGLSGKPKRCPPEVRAVFLQRTLQSDGGPPDRLLRLLAAKHVAAPRSELRALRDALGRNWLVGGELAPATEQFAESVRDVARTTKHGVFGDRKVFISSVWDELRRKPTYSHLTLDDFKARLVRAHHDGDVVLARADLVAAMSPQLVAASEITADGASFHFIVREDRP